MTATTRSTEDLIVEIRKEIHVRASLATTFEALLEQIGPYNERPDGVPMPMKLEAWPGGRWYRDLGGNDGHFWGHVQAIKRPTLLEITGPLFSSAPLLSNVQYRLKEDDGGTVISLRHAAVGFMEEQFRQGVQTGWTFTLEKIRTRAEGLQK